MHRQEDTAGCEARLCAEEAVAGRHEQILTEDGSVTLCVPELHEHYHSVHGAIQEARHIFLRAGMDDYLAARADSAGSTLPLHILEAGFGTGLNAYLTLLHAEETQIPVCYHSLEKYPLQPEEIATLNYAEQTGRGNDPLFRALHEAAWEEDIEVTPRLDGGSFRPFPPGFASRRQTGHLLRERHRQTRPPLSRLHPRTPARTSRETGNAPRGQKKFNFRIKNSQTFCRFKKYNYLCTRKGETAYQHSPLSIHKSASVSTHIVHTMYIRIPVTTNADCAGSRR